jgi:hypothetical protein
VEKTSHERSKKAAAPKGKQTTLEPIVKIDKSSSKNKRNSKQNSKLQSIVNPAQSGVSIS